MSPSQKQAQRPTVDRWIDVIARLFPRSFRHRFEDDMKEVLRTEHRESRRRGRGALLAFWSRTVLDTLRAAPREHLDGLLLDTRYAARRLRRKPLFLVAATASLAIGIGATTTVVAVFKAAFIDSIPGIEEPSRLINVKPILQPLENFELISYPYYRELRENSPSLDGLAGFHGTMVNLDLGSDGEGEVRPAQLVSNNYFETLGVKPRMGRFFPLGAAEHDRPEVVVSSWLWTNRLGQISIGSDIRLNGSALTVIGVTPEGFRGHFKGFSFDLFLPVGLGNLAGRPDLADPSGRWIEMVGRLAEGHEITQARASIELQGRRLAESEPGEYGNLELVVEPMTGIDADMRGGMLTLLATLFVVTGSVLLIACMNVAGMMLGDLAWRSNEMAVRRALGAPPSRLARQLLLESGLLALLAGAGGTLLAFWATGAAAAALGGIDSSVSLDIHVDPMILLAVLALSLITALGAGLSPGWAAARTRPADSLRVAGRSAAGSEPRFFRVLVAGQVLLSFTVLVCASLFARALDRAVTLDPGFDTGGVLVARVAPNLAGMDADQGAALFSDLEERVAQMPSVQASALTDRVPLSLGARFFPNPLELRIPGWEPPMEQDGFLVEHSLVSPGFLQTLKIPLVEGRFFDHTDRLETAKVAVVNETFAQRFFDGQSPLGQVLQREKDDITIVGVARDSRYRTLDEDPMAYVYLPFDQHQPAGLRPVGATLLVRPGQAGAGLAEALRRTMRELAPALPIDEIGTLENRLAASFLPQRLAATIAGSLGFLGLVLSSIGLYGVLGIWVSHRAHEISLRVTLGARPSDIARLVLRQGLLLTAAGIFLGVPVAMVGARLFSAFLLGVSTLDLPTYALVTTLLLVTAIVASLIPARRAMRSDPLAVLRHP